MIELALRDAEILKWGFDVCLDFGRLAWETLFGPNPHLFLETTPHTLMSFRVVRTEG